ncbi:MAG: tetratricopeptide repeat protein, partial [Marinicaulis sp.]|nr:tetratricopeptide repeat protein [Marinicaulis sp.]
MTTNSEFIALAADRIDVLLPSSENLGNGGFRETEFLEDLNIRSEPFEEWRRDYASGLFGRHENYGMRVDATSNGPSKRSAPPIGQTESGERGRRVFPARLLWGVVAAAAVIAGVLFISAGGFESLNRNRKPYTHGQNSIEIMRQTAVRKTHPELNSSIDRCEFDRADPNDVIAACTRVVDALGNDDPYKAVALTIRGSAHRWNGNFSQSTEDISQALLIDPTYHNAHHHMAYSYFLKGDYDQALEHYEKVKELFPVYVMAHYRTGEVYSAMDDHRNAERAFSLAIELAPDFGHAYLMRGRTRITLSKNEAAQSDLRLAASLRPSNGCTESLCRSVWRLIPSYSSGNEKNAAAAAARKNATANM